MNLRRRYIVSVILINFLLMQIGSIITSNASGVEELKVTYSSYESKSVLKGQALVPIGTLTISSEKDTSVVGLELSRTGNSNDSDISDITVWDGNIRLNAFGIFSNGICEIKFIDPLIIKEGHAKNIVLKMNVSTNTKLDSQITISVTNVKVSSLILIKAVFPMVFSTISIPNLPTFDFGSISASPSTDSPTENIEVGSKNVILAKYTFYFTNANQTLNHITFTQDGSIFDSDLSNLRLFDGEIELAKGILINRKITFDFVRECMSGQNVRLTLKGDVEGGLARTIMFNIENVNDVQSMDKTFGTTSILDSATRGIVRYVNASGIILSRDGSSPATGIVNVVMKDHKFTSIRIEAIGESVRVERLNVFVTTTGDFAWTSKINALKIIRGATLLGQVENPWVGNNIVGTSVAPIVLYAPITVKPGEPVVLDITADFGNNMGYFLPNSTIVMGISNGVLSGPVVGTGMISGRKVYSRVTDDIYGNKFTVGVLNIDDIVKPTPTPTPTPTPNHDEISVGFTNVTYTATESRAVVPGQALIRLGMLSFISDTDTFITGVNINRIGKCEDIDVSNITVWDDSSKLNVPGIFSNGICDITFIKPLRLKAGIIKNIDLKMNVSHIAKTGSQISIAVVDITSSPLTTIKSTFPMVLGIMTVAQKNLLGTVSVVSSVDAPNGNIDAGSNNVSLAKYDFVFANEAQILNQITFTQDGSISDSDLSNLKLFDGDTEIATGILINRKIIFRFAREYEVGAVAKLTLRGNVDKGSGKTILFTIDDINDVQTIGNTYGTSIVLDCLTPVFGKFIFVNLGELLISVDPSSPVVSNIKNVEKYHKFTSIKFEAIGEPIQLRKLTITSKNSNFMDKDKIYNLKLLNGNNVLAWVQRPFGWNDACYVMLSSPMVVNPKNPIIIDIYADIGNELNQFELNSTIQMGVSNGFNSVEGIAMTSGTQMSKYLYEDIMGNVFTVDSIATPTPTPTPIIVSDTIPPIVYVKPYNMFLTNNDVVVEVETDEGTLNATSHTFTENGSFVFKSTDLAGNIGTATLIVNNIDKTKPTCVLSKDHEDNIVRYADTVVITAGFSENMGNAPTVSIDLPGNDADILVVPMVKGADAKTWTYSWNVPAGHDGSATVTVAGNDTIGNVYVGGDTLVFTIDNKEIPPLAGDTAKYELKTNILPNKIWTIKLNRKIDVNSIGKIYVAYDAEGTKKITGIEVKVGDDANQVKVNLDGKLPKGTYYLIIRNDLKNETGKMLNKNVVMPFQINMI